MALNIYNFPNIDDTYGSRRVMDDDDQDWQERSLYSRRHDGLYKSRLEQMQEEWMEENEE